MHDGALFDPIQTIAEQCTGNIGIPSYLQGDGNCFVHAQLKLKVKLYKWSNHKRTSQYESLIFGQKASAPPPPPPLFILFLNIIYFLKWILSII